MSCAPSAISRSKAAVTSWLRISTSAAANAASMSSGAAAAAATASGRCAVARSRKVIWRQRAFGFRVARIGIQDRLVGRRGRHEVTGLQLLARLGHRGVDLLHLGILGAAELSGRRRSSRVHPAPQLIGRQGTLEAVHAAGRRRCHDGGHRLDAEHLGDPGHHVDVDGGQRPLTLVGCGQRREIVDQLHTDLAARGPQQHDDRKLAGADQNLGFEVGFGDLDTTGGGGAARCGLGGSLLETGEVDGTGQRRRDRGAWTRHALKFVTSVRGPNPPGRDPLPVPSLALRSAHMRKITLPSGTMLPSNASNHVRALQE